MTYLRARRSIPPRPAWNAAVSPVRRRVEKIFGTAKRGYGLPRARHVKLTRVTPRSHLTFIAYNLKRTTALLPHRRLPRTGLLQRSA